VLSAGVIDELELDVLSGSPIDGSCRPCTRCPWWPVGSGLDARRFVCGRTVEVHLVGRSAVEVFVRSVLIVPVEMAGKLSPHVITAQRQNDSARALVLKGADETLDHGNAAVLAHGAKPWTNSFTLAPCLESAAPELRAFVADDVLRLGLGMQTTEEGTDLDGRDLRVMRRTGSHPRNRAPIGNYRFGNALGTYRKINMFNMLIMMISTVVAD